MLSAILICCRIKQSQMDYVCRKNKSILAWSKIFYSYLDSPDLLLHSGILLHTKLSVPIMEIIGPKAEDIIAGITRPWKP